MEGVVEAEEVIDGFCDEKLGIFAEISLVETIFDFLLFSGRSNVSTQIE